MIDLNVIKARYGAMTNGELINFALEDGSSLTKEAFHLLKNEFVARKLSARLTWSDRDTGILEAIEDGTFSEHKEAINNIENTIVREFSTTVLAHALNEKRDGRSDEAIISGLIETGMDERDALVLISQLERHAQMLLARANTTMLTAAFICIAGIAFYMISPKKPVVTLMDILSVCAIGFGIIRFLKGLFDKNKFVAVIRNIAKALF